MQTFHVTAEDAHKRLDQFLVSQLADISRARVQQLIQQDKVTVNGKLQRASYRMTGEEEVVLLGEASPSPLKATPENIPLDVVFEDDSLAVINKPAGMMVHAGAGQSSANDDEEGDPRTHGTLVNALLYRFKKLSAEGGDLRPGIVHRLDKDTSGLIIVAKTDAAHRKLAEQFAGRVVKKKYIALVHGWPKQEKCTIHAAIGRDRARRNRMSTKSKDGRDAVTHYRTMKEFSTPFGKFSLLEVTIETGRTHQIRVHLTSIGHPVVGDTLYGSPAELVPTASAYRRAQPANTKANRDREASELARRLTEEATGTAPPKTRKKQISSAKDAQPLVRLSLPRNFLHAMEIEFQHPKTGKTVGLKSDLPSELAAFLERLTHLQ